MINLYIGLRINQYAIICGPQLDGKTSLWKILFKAINTFMSHSITTPESGSKEILKKYSLLTNYLSESENQQFAFPRIIAHHLFPKVYNNTKVS